MFKSARSRYAPAILGTRRRGNGVAASIGSKPGDCTSGTAATFDKTRADFEAAWRAFLPKRTEADFRAWRHQRDWTAKKYRPFDRGERMPPPQGQTA